MASQGIIVSVGTTATRLDSATETDTNPGSSSPRGDGQRITLYNAGAVSIWIGGSGVAATGGAASSQGFEVVAGGGFSEVLKPGDAIYGITATGTCLVNVMRVGV